MVSAGQGWPRVVRRASGIPSVRCREALSSGACKRCTLVRAKGKSLGNPTHNFLFYDESFSHNLVLPPHCLRSPLLISYQPLYL